MLHFLERMPMHGDVRKDERFNSVLKYPEQTTGLSSLVSSSVMMWLCAFFPMRCCIDGEKREGHRPFQFNAHRANKPPGSLQGRERLCLFAKCK